MDNFDLSEQRIVQLEQIPVDIRSQIEKGDAAEYALDLSLNRLRSVDQIGIFEHVSQTLDLSDNMLGAFSSSVSGTIFPSRLRRLSIARNQIDKICGVASIGLHLPVLEFLAFDGNPIVLELARSGGQLERLVAAFFPCLPLSNDGGLTISGQKHEEFATPPHVLNSLKRGILEGNEIILEAFLATGALTPQGNFGEVFPPPLPVERQLSNRHHVQDQPVPENPLTHDNKLEIWKRIQEDRKAQSGSFTPANSDVKREKSIRWGEHSAASTPVDNVRKPALTTADLAVSDHSTHVMSALDVSGLSIMKPSDSMLSASTEPIQNSNGGELETLVKKLTDQVTTMRNDGSDALKGEYAFDSDFCAPEAAAKTNAAFVTALRL
ncbi:hypothetical protein PInf_020348 [Phytophthora infestans]|nr:hypothetical protein PInf_020348 [Phytophthora infestans]